MYLCLGKVNGPWSMVQRRGGSMFIHGGGGEGRGGHQALGEITKTINSFQKVSVTGNTQ